MNRILMMTILLTTVLCLIGCHEDEAGSDVQDQHEDEVDSGVQDQPEDFDTGTLSDNGPDSSDPSCDFGNPPEVVELGGDPIILDIWGNIEQVKWTETRERHCDLHCATQFIMVVQEGMSHVRIDEEIVYVGVTSESLQREIAEAFQSAEWEEAVGQEWPDCVERREDYREYIQLTIDPGNPNIYIGMAMQGCHEEFYDRLRELMRRGIEELVPQE